MDTLILIKRHRWSVASTCRWSGVDTFNYTIQMNFLYVINMKNGKYDRSTIFS